MLLYSVTYLTVLWLPEKYINTGKWVLIMLKDKLTSTTTKLLVWLITTNTVV